MLIQIVRAVRLALFDREVQSLQPGEIYDVAPSVGHVLVTDGWAREVTQPLAARRIAWHDAGETHPSSVAAS